VVDGYIDSPAVLALPAVAELTSLLRRCVQTVGDSQFTKRAARAAESPVLLGTLQARCHLPGRAFAEP